MDDEILAYYERELTFIRHMGEEFARKYPKVAGRLRLEPDRCDDPHTERLIEAFALLCGRVHKRIDDGLPEIAQALLNIVYPHYLNPIPSQSVVAFKALKTTPQQGYRIESGTTLYSRPVGGSPLQFRTCYPVTLWPLEVAWAGLRDADPSVPRAQQVVVIGLKSYNALSFADIACDKLRFFLNGPAQHVFHLYELLFNNVCRLELRWAGAGGITGRTLLPPEAIGAVGFTAQESVLPTTQRSFPGYLLLFEYFSFPEKFLFFDILDPGAAWRRVAQDSLELCIYLDRNPKPGLLIGADTFSLHATPAVNLFSRIAEPIQVEQRRHEYRVIPDVRRQEATEVFSIDAVAASEAGSPAGGVAFTPFYSLRHGFEEEDERQRKAYWHMERRYAEREGDQGTDVFLSFTDWGLNPAAPEVETLTVYTTCTNRDLPGQLPFGGASGDFELELAAPVEKISCLVKPTPPRRPALAGSRAAGRGGRNPLLWRVISHLSLNYLSLVRGGEEALREILKIYDFDDTPATRQQISGIVSLETEYVTRRVGRAFCRGLQVTAVLDEEKFVGGGYYLFACILDAFLGQYVSVNSFSQLVARSMQTNQVLKKWPARSGNRILL